MARAKRATQITLGELIRRLETCTYTKPVMISLDARDDPEDEAEDHTVGDIDSYRGRTEQLALDPTYRGYYTEGEKVSEVLQMLKDVVGKELYGYKGGLETMTEDTLLRAASYGMLGPCVVDVQEFKNRVVIFTDGSID